jgi:amidase/aspartyl-tRNA(Asn)/glutamyl-tRNA(Gln) amidotransferase subunit A
MREAAVLYAKLAVIFKKKGIYLLGEHRHELAPEFAELLERGQALGAVEYKLDDIVRTEVFDVLQNLFQKYDLLVTPTLAVPPFDNASQGNTIGPSTVHGEKVNPLLGWCLTYPFNFTGHPAASIPAGFTDDGLPIGLQIVGRRFADDTVLAASAAFERVKPWQDAYPSR